METFALLFITFFVKIYVLYIQGDLCFLIYAYSFACPWQTLPKAEINAAHPLPFSFLLSPFLPSLWRVLAALPRRRKIVFQALELVSEIREFWFPTLFMSGHRPPSLSSFVHPPFRLPHPRDSSRLLPSFLSLFCVTTAM